MKRFVLTALSLVVAAVVLFSGFPVSLETAALQTDDLAASSELQKLENIDMLTGTTMESGPAHPHTTPRTVVLDENATDVPMPTHRLANYLQSRGIMFPGDTVKFILKDNPDMNEHYLNGGPTFYSNGEPYDFKPGDTWGPFEIVSTQVRGSNPAHNYITEIKVIGDNPVMLKDGWAGGSGWAADTDSDGYAYHTYSVWCVDYIILPRYHRVIYEYPEGIDPDELIYPDNMPALPEVIWAEDLSFSWPEMTGTLFTLPRPINEGYVFRDYNIKWGSEHNFEAGQVVGDGQECEQWRFFFSGAEDYSWRFENRKEGDEEGQPITVSVDIQKGNTVTIDANGGTINGFDRFIYNFDSDYYRSIDLGDDQPVREGFVFDGYYEDAACTKLVAANNSYDLYWVIKRRYESLGVSHQTLYARWADPGTKDIANLRATLSSMPYTGEPITQDPVIKDGDYTLVKDKDYRILQTTDNINVGTAYVTYQGIGNYRGANTKSFSITRKPVTLHITLDQDTFTYDGTEHKPGNTVTCDEVQNLVEGADYTVSYNRNKNASTENYPAYVYASLNSNSNYSGSAYAYFTINRKKINPVVTLSNTVYTADGEPKTPAVTVMDGETILSAGYDYNLQFSDNIEPGTATVTVTLKGNYEGEAVKNFTLKKADKTFDVSLDPSYDFTYKWDYHQPDFVVKSNGKTLTNGTDYEITYKNNFNAGTATAIISGINKYAGATKTETFEIVPADISITNPDPISDQYYTGYPLRPGVYVPNPFGSYQSLTRDYHYTVRYENNTNIGVGTVYITGIGDYQGEISLNFNIIEPKNTVETDEATGIVINFSWKTSTTHLKVTEKRITDEDIASVDTDGYDKLCAYNIIVVDNDGNPTTLSRYYTATYAIPCDDPKACVFRVDEEGVARSIYSYYQDGYLLIRDTYYTGDFIIAKEKPKPVTHTDRETGISVVANNDLTLSVTERADFTAEVEGNILAAYDIKLLRNGSVVQPDEEVTVSIPCDDPDAKIYHVEADNTLTDMNASYENGRKVFKTGRFSVFLVVSEKEKLLGDIDGDSKVTIIDATMIQRHLASIQIPFTLNKKAADADGDGSVTILDSTFIQKWLAKIPSNDNIGKPIS